MSDGVPLRIEEPSCVQSGVSGPFVNSDHFWRYPSGIKFLLRHVEEIFHTWNWRQSRVGWDPLGWPAYA